MNNVGFATLAAVRAVDPEEFDRNIKRCIYEAAEQVGSEVAVKALCSPSQLEQAKLAA